MFPHANALLIASTYFTIFMIVGPGLVAWIYEDIHAKRDSQTKGRVMPFSPTSGTFDKAA